MSVSPTPPPGPARPVASERRRRRAVLAGFVLLYFALQLPSLIRRSATYDEPIHLTAGYLALTQRDYRLETTHPPLLRLWAALPLLARPGPAPDTAALSQWPEAEWHARAYALADDFLYGRSGADVWLNLARGMTLSLGALLGILVFAWAREWLGFGPAVAALGLYLVCPNLAAHAALVTTDFGVTCFFFGAAYFLWRTLRMWTGANLAGLALFTGLAAASKYSAVLLGPAVLLVLTVAVARGDTSARRAAGIALLLGVSAWAALWAVYGFRYASATGFAAPLAELQAQMPWVGRVLAWVDSHRLLPAAYTHGFGLSLTSAAKIPAYLAGEYSPTGWWYYFPVAMLIKTPMALLLPAMAGAVIVAWRGISGRERLGFCVLLPPAVYLAVAMTSEINLGLRHVLPVYPFLVVVAAVALAAVWRADWSMRTRGWVLGSVAASAVLGLAWSYPSRLTFFNVLVGGPGKGSHYLVDSNLDWGQHLKLLKRWMDEQQIDHLNLAYFGAVKPAYYGIACTPLPGSIDFIQAGGPHPRLPGYVAISATVLSGVYSTPEWRLFYRGFAAMEPVAVVGNTINVYWVERWPLALAPRGAAAEKLEEHRALGRSLTILGWDDYAVVHLRRYLRRYPDHGRVLLRLGHVLLRKGQTEEALRLYRRSVACAPQDSEGHGALATVLLARRDAAGAIPHARLQAQLDPANPFAHGILGLALAADQQWATAAAALARAVELAPDNAALRGHLERVRQRLARVPARF